MSDLRSRRWIVAKGAMFAGIALLSAFLLWLQAASWQTSVLIALLAWSAARFYYFLFYVLGTYVDPRLRYAGILALLRELRRSRASAREDPPSST